MNIFICRWNFFFSLQSFRFEMFRFVWIMKYKPFWKFEQLKENANVFLPKYLKWRLPECLSFCQNGSLSKWKADNHFVCAKKCRFFVFSGCRILSCLPLHFLSLFDTCLPSVWLRSLFPAHICIRLWKQMYIAICFSVRILS